MPIFLSGDDGGLASGVEVSCDPRLDLFGDEALEVLAFAVLGVEALGEACGFEGVVGEEQLKGGIGFAEAACGIDARAEAEADVG